MSNTIKAKMFLLSDEDTARVTGYLKSCGMTFASGVTDQVFVFELKNTPEIVIRLEGAGFHGSGSREWQIIGLSEHGVCLYLANQAGDGYVFIPRENIIAMHSIDLGMIHTARRLNAKDNT